MRKLLLATSALLGASVGMAGVASAGTLTPNAPHPAPGSITVTLNALVEAFVFQATDSGTNNLRTTAGTKTASYGIASYSRLYPSFDGVLANGLKYGASLEIRHNALSNGDSVSGPSGRSPTFYVQREFLYIGADKFGKVSLGSPVQPSELFQTGNPANFNTGGWDGDLPGVFTSGIPYFIDDDADQANKITYVSPQFAGFDFGVSFEPNFTSSRDFGKVYGRASSVPGDDSRLGNRRNTVDGAARYQGAFGPVGFKANVGGSFGGAIRSSDFDPTLPVSATNRANHKDFSFIGGGVAVTFGGLEIDGHIDTGKFGPDYSTLVTGATGTTAYIVGGSYTIGPVIFGASYYGFDSGYTRPASVTGSALHGYGIAAGGTYTLAPGASLFLEYLYGHQRANGIDLVNGTDPTVNNRTRAQAFGIGTAFKW